MSDNKPLKFTEEQDYRLYELSQAAYAYLISITGNPNLIYDQEVIDQLNNLAANFMYQRGFRVYYPSIKTDKNGNQHSKDFYEPDTASNGVMVNGAYFCESMYGKYVDGYTKIEDWSKFMPKVTSYDSGTIPVWAHNEAEAGDVAGHLTSEDIRKYRTCDHVGIRADFAQPDVHANIRFVDFTQPDTHVSFTPADNLDHPEERLVLLTLKDQDGLDVRISSLMLKTTLLDDQIIPAIMEASKDYLKTPEGHTTWENNCHNFNFGDFDMNVCNEFCIPHGIYRMDENISSVIEEDFNLQLAAMEDLTYEVKLKDGVVKVTVEDIDDIMESAMTGCVYWCSHADVVGDYLGDCTSEQISRGGSIIFYDIEDERSSAELTRDKFLNGLRMLLETQNGLHTLMVKKDGESMRIDPGMIDANAADSIIQYALFGELIYA